MKLDIKEFLNAIGEGREIEINFQGKCYFLSSKKAKRGVVYLFNEVSSPKSNHIMAFDSIYELMKVNIENQTLIEILSNIEDYTIF